MPSGSLVAQPALTLSTSHQGEPIGFHLSYVLVSDDQAWARPPASPLPALAVNTSPTLDAGFRKGTAYARLILRNESQVPRTIYLEQRHVFTPSIQLFDENSQALHTLSYANTGTRLAGQIHNFPVFRLQVPPGEHTYWFEVRGVPKRLNLYLWDENSFQEGGQGQFILLMMLMVIPLIFILQHLFLFLTHRDPTHLAYVLFLSSVWAMSVISLGLTRFIFSEAWSAWLYQKGIYLTYLFISITALRFCQLIIPRDPTPRLDQALKKWERVQLALLFILPFLPFGAHFLNVLLFPLGSGLVAAHFLVCSLRSGQRVARYYIVGATPMLFQLFYSVSIIFLNAPYLGLLELLTPISQSSLALALSLGLGKLIEQREKSDSEKIARLNQELREHLLNVEEIVASKTAKIHSILAHIKQAIFTINTDGRLDSEYSAVATEIFRDRNIDGADAVELFFDRTALTGDQLSQIRSALVSVLGEDAVNFDLNRSLFPFELIRELADASQQILECDWIPVINQEGKTERILVAIRDVTEHRKLLAQNQQQTETVLILNELLNVNPLQMSRFFQQAQEYLDQSLPALTLLAHGDKESLADLFIRTHTLKGISRLLHFKQLTDILHSIEDELQKARNHTLTGDSLERKFQTFADLLQRFQELSASLFRKDEASAASHEPQKDLQKALQLLDGLSLPTQVREQPAYGQLRETLENACLVSMDGFLDELRTTLRQLARNLAKAEPVLQIEQAAVRLTPRQDIVLRNIFIHLTRNAMDHGIETDAERIQSNKAPGGTLMLSIQPRSHHIIIQFSDDGRGLDLESIRSKADRQGLIPAARAWSAEELADLIFADGLSTRDNVTEISGRGVGLSAVRKMLEDAGGSIRVVLRDSQGSTRRFYFEMTLPKYDVRRTPDAA
ncbi:7TM diverse intracellular signaling domain-containing protein [Oligoflexus tunisiensis]|uniref:7TM diverse intracellular signaling domain-containing protein n=1 Tax=Oligoflexus tunisiensis TaxID=708132 RepID=UPI001C4083BA|nr:7TM diverse intracellular signaling domain-containing protein [Oligoflexus tunisiensis]